MPRKVLIIHGEDALKEADWLQAELKNNSIDSWTLASAMEEAPRGDYAVIYHSRLVIKSRALIFIASPKLFKNGFLENMAEIAFFSHKFIPILLGHQGTKLRSWFFHSPVINLNSKVINGYEDLLFRLENLN